MSEEFTKQPRPFKWTDAAHRAAFRIAEGTLTFDAICRIVGCKIGVLTRWRNHPEFVEQVEVYRDEIAESVKLHSLANHEERMTRYQDRLDRIHQLVRSRADEMAGEVAGGETGLLVRTPKNVTLEIIDEEGEVKTRRTEAYLYQFDRAVISEERELLKQVSIEAGQWSEKREHSGPDGGPIQVNTIEVALNDEDDA